MLDRRKQIIRRRRIRKIKNILGKIGKYADNLARNYDTSPFATSPRQPSRKSSKKKSSKSSENYRSVFEWNYDDNFKWI